MTGGPEKDACVLLSAAQLPVGMGKMLLMCPAASILAQAFNYFTSLNVILTLECDHRQVHGHGPRQVCMQTTGSETVFGYACEHM